MAKVAVIGAGAMGLAAAYHAVKAGHAVTVYEAGPVPGGMAAHFDLDGLSLERFYHFVCTSDQPTFDLLDELGLGDAMRWRATTMGQFIDGKLHKLGDPFSLLAFPAISLLARLRYGLFAFVSTRRNRWDALEHQNARDWIVRWAGAEVFERLYRPLFALKFYEFADDISASWIWTRIRRIGRSRKSLFEEKLGYIDGGSETLVTALVDAIEARGGTIRLATPIDEVRCADGKAVGVVTAAGLEPADAVIATVPTPLVSTMVPALPAEWKTKYDAIPIIGVCCLVFKLRRPVTPHFWVNIAQPGVPIPGIVEFSNLRPMPGGEAVVFVPYYMPVTNPRFAWEDQALLDEAFEALRLINPTLTSQDVLASRVSRLKYAQPVCAPGFAAMIPPVQTPIAGLQIADTCFYYPEDRGIAESVRLGKEMAEHLGTAERTGG